MTRTIARPDQLAAAADEITQADRVCVDTEFHAERRYLPKLYLVQIHIPGGSTWLIDPRTDAGMGPVADALSRTPWLVHAGRQDLKILNEWLPALPEEVLDTQIAAGLVGTEYPAAMTHLVSAWLGQTATKGATLSDWSRRPLTPEQLDYAADDVEILPSLWAALEEKLTAYGRHDTARHACAEAKRQGAVPPDPDEAWKALSAANLLDGPGRAVLQELCGWRELRARSTNQPVRSVLSDGLTMELSRRRPTSVAQMTANRRFPKRVAGKWGEELVAAIARAAQRPEWGWPVIAPRGSDAARRVSFFGALLDIAAGESSWARQLVCPDVLTRELSIKPPATREALSVLLGWRDALVGDLFWSALQGRTTLSIQGGIASIASTAPQY